MNLTDKRNSIIYDGEKDELKIVTHYDEQQFKATWIQDQCVEHLKYLLKSGDPQVKNHPTVRMVHAAKVGLVWTIAIYTLLLCLFGIILIKDFKLTVFLLYLLMVALYIGFWIYFLFGPSIKIYRTQRYVQRKNIFNLKQQSALYLKKHGLPEGICELKAFPEWKLELMALKIFETVWGNRREAVLEACRMLNACYREESADPAKLKALDKRMDALNQRLDNLIMMKASNQITLSQFVEQSNEIGVQQQRVNKEKAELLAKQGDHKALDMDAIEASLCEAVDFTDGMVSEWFIQNFVRRITPIDDTRFAWVLDLAPEPQTLVCEVNGRKEYPRITLESNLYRGVWPPSGASRRPFLINRNGRMNGDISVEGLEHDRLLLSVHREEQSPHHPCVLTSGSLYYG